MLPNLVIIGAPKAGTTALHRYLSEHPEVFMSEQKELQYFQRDDWRGVAAALGRPASARAVVVSPGSGPMPLGLYEGGLRPMPARGAAVAEPVGGGGNRVRKLPHGSRGRHSAVPRRELRALAGSRSSRGTRRGRSASRLGRCSESSTMPV